MNIRQRLARLEAGFRDPLSDRSNFEVRRRKALQRIRQNIEALGSQHRELELPVGGHTVPRIENLKELVEVERSAAEVDRAEAFLASQSGADRRVWDEMEEDVRAVCRAHAGNAPGLPPLAARHGR